MRAVTSLFSREPDIAIEFFSSQEAVSAPFQIDTQGNGDWNVRGIQWSPPRPHISLGESGARLSWHGTETSVVIRCLEFVRQLPDPCFLTLSRDIRPSRHMVIQSETQMQWLTRDLSTSLRYGFLAYDPRQKEQEVLLGCIVNGEQILAQVGTTVDSASYGQMANVAMQTCQLLALDPYRALGNGPTVTVLHEHSMISPGEEQSWTFRSLLRNDSHRKRVHIAPDAEGQGWTGTLFGRWQYATLLGSDERGPRDIVTYGIVRLVASMRSEDGLGLEGDEPYDLVALASDGSLQTMGQFIANGSEDVLDDEKGTMLQKAIDNPAGYMHWPRTLSEALVGHLLPRETPSQSEPFTVTRSTLFSMTLSLQWCAGDEEHLAQVVGGPRR